VSQLVGRGQRHVDATLGRAGSTLLASVAGANLDAVRRALTAIGLVGLGMSFLSAA
jgi:hypothetical protein